MMEPLEETRELRDPDGDGLPRRGFLAKAAAAGTGALAALGPIAAAGYAALDPLRRKGDGDAPFIQVATADALPADGKARLFRVAAARQDAWTRHARLPLGAVYLRRLPETPGEVLALHATCPHLGCFVSAAADGGFHCPCHDSTFASDGSIASAGSPSPRGLDPLEARIEGQAILVRFLNFETGRPERVPIV